MLCVSVSCVLGLLLVLVHCEQYCPRSLSALSPEKTHVLSVFSP